jgi:transcription elongation regulator 1
MFSHRTTFSEFSLKHGKDERFKDIAKMKERESLFSEYVAELRKLERQASQKKKDFVDEKVMFYFQCWVGLEPQ